MEPSNAATKVGERNLALDLEIALKENAELKQKYDELEKAHRETLDYIDKQNRARLCAELKEITKLSVEDMDKMSTDALEQLRDSYRWLKKPVVGIKDFRSVEPDSKIVIADKFKFERK